MTNTSKGIIFLILSAFSFAAMALFVRLAGEINFIEKAFFRNFVSLLIALVFLIREGRDKGWDSVDIPKGALIFLFIRATAGSIGIFGNFYAIDRLVLSDASILNKMSPFFAILFSIFLMKEKVRLVPMLAIIGAFLGAMLVVKPSFNFTQTLPTLAGFIGGMGAGLAYACVRKLSSLKCNGKVIVLFFSVYSCLLSLPHMIMHWEPLTTYQLTFLILAGVWAACGQFAITAAYFHAPAREISIYDYSQIIFSASFGFFVFGMIPDWMSLTGYAVIISMAVLNFWWNKKQKGL
ncbi:MAG: DMT family transporter [Treponema sp.]|nr:DMT family transporter [Treponema sp.]